MESLTEGLEEEKGSRIRGFDKGRSSNRLKTV